ncbi:MAG: hypothetical protein WCK16_01370 [Candidatus Moraniibacteriota bacterium]
MTKIESIATAIKKYEGFFPPSAQYPKGSKSYRNNNPGNLIFTKYTKSLGAIKESEGFSYFSTYETGWKALRQLLFDAFSGKLISYKKEMSLLEFFSKYAFIGVGKMNYPYAQFVSSQTGISIETKIGTLLTGEPPIIDPPIVPSVPLKIYNQLSYRGVKFGSKKMTDIGAYGCKLCAVAMLLQKDPVEVDKLLVKGGAYFGASGDLLSDEMIARTFGWQFFGKETNIDKPPTWSLSIKEVDFSAAAGRQQHFVVRFVKTDGTKVILDPYGGIERIVNFYEKKSGNFVSYRLFKII